MRGKTCRVAGLTTAALSCLTLACTALGLGDFAAFLGPGVLVVIENDTSFTASVDLRTSEGRNVFEDFLESENQITEFGTNGAVQPNQTVSVRLTCDDELELIFFGGASFREGNGFPLGDIDADTRLRRDSGFDCGDTIHIRLGGTIFNFHADVDVERAALGSDGDEDASADDTVADFLDNLFD